MKKINQDELVIEELKAHELSGLSRRCKVAIKELAGKDEGAIIFLLLSLNTRIRQLEEVINYMTNEKTMH